MPGSFLLLTLNAIGVALRGSQRTELSGLNRHLSLADYAVAYGGPAGLVWNRRFDTASHLSSLPADDAGRTTWDQVAGVGVWVEFSRSLLLLSHFVQKGPPLFAGQELEEPRHGLEQ